MLRLKNNTGGISRIGRLVVLDPKDKSAYVYAGINVTSAIGIITESVPYRQSGNVATAGEKALVYVIDGVAINSQIRSSKSGDVSAKGACHGIKPADSSYFRVGTAVKAGRGLVSCIIDLTYIAGSVNQNSIVSVTSSPYTIGSTDGLIICNSTSAITVNLPVASGSGRTIEICNINTGLVTVNGNLSDTINGELTQPVYDDNSMAIKDYTNNKWVII